MLDGQASNVANKRWLFAPYDRSAHNVSSVRLAHAILFCPISWTAWAWAWFDRKE